MSRMSGVLVGRGPVLATALAALEEAMKGAGQLLAVSGEPGIGKSAVLTELAGQAARRGARVLRGACWDGGGAPAYWPWTQVLRAATELGPTGLSHDELGAASRLLATPTDSGPAPARSRDASDPATARFQLLDAVATALARLASDAPVVVVLDDLQWADEPSLQLLNFLGRQLRAEPVLLLAAYRDAEAGPALRAVVSGGQQLPLVGLTAADVRQLMITVASPDDHAPPPAQLVDQVWRRCGGNPFFARELTRLIIAQGGWGADPAVGRVATDSGGTVPDTVRDTLERRLARLSQPCADVLAVAAVAGVELREELLGLVVRADGDRPPLAELLAEAAAARVLVQAAEPAARYRFTHDLYRETIQAGLTPAARGKLHLAVGRALEQLRAQGAEVHLAEVASHLLVSVSREALADAVGYCAAAAVEALDRLGYEDARDHFEHALDAWERVGGEPSQRLDLLLGLADARYRAGDRESARDDLHRAAELARRVADVDGLARTAVALHDLGARGAGPEARANVELLTEVAATLPAQPSPLRARVLTALVRSMRHQSAEVDEDRIVAAAREAVQVAKAVDEPSAVAFALLALHDALWQPGTGPQRLDVLDEMREAAQAAGERDLLVRIYQLRAAALLECGDPRGRAELAHYVQLAAGRGDALGRWNAMTRQATLAVIEGRWADAGKLAVEALEFGLAIGEPDATGAYGTVNGALLLFGEVQVEWDLPSDRLAESSPAPYYDPVLRAIPLIASGELDAARHELAGYVVDDMLANFNLEPLAILASVIAAAGTDRQRERVYERLKPYAGLNAVVGGCAGYWGAVDHHLGALAAALGRQPQAAAHLESAIGNYTKLGAPAWAELCRPQLDNVRASESSTSDPERPVLRFDGGSWELDYRGTQVHLPDAKGLRDIATLLSGPGQPVHVLRLLGVEEPTGADPVLDEQARQAYRARLGELDAEIEQARSWQDLARAERATLERTALISELTAATGLAGRTRRLGDRTERARKTVTARIRDALRRIDRAHPELAEHLRGTIRTGTECEYTPPRVAAPNGGDPADRPRG
jgi:tetratricopeptide (TPR) repeat protein